jgi:hypothetical protein
VGSERGFVSVRGLVLFGLVVAAVWVVPLMLLQDVKTEPAGPTAVGATAIDEPAGGTTGATGATGATPAGDPVSDPIREANDVRAQAMLNEAIRVSEVYYAEHGSFDGFGPDAAAGYDPSIVYARAPAPDTVAMSVSPTTVVLVTVVEPNGGYLCAAAMGDIVTFGRTNATMPADCQGGWD